MDFECRNFKTLCPDSESAPPRYHVSQFSVKMNNFEFFGLNLGKLPNCMGYFVSNNIEGVAESWVEAEMSWVEVDGAEGRLKWAEWRWMELGLVDLVDLTRLRFIDEEAGNFKVDGG